MKGLYKKETYKVMKTVVSPSGIENTSLCTTEDFETAQFWLLNSHAKDLKIYEGRPFFRTKWAYIVKPDKYTTICVEIESE